jgi:hypothetical protein
MGGTRVFRWYANWVVRGAPVGRGRLLGRLEFPRVLVFLLAPFAAMAAMARLRLPSAICTKNAFCSTVDRATSDDVFGRL